MRSIAVVTPMILSRGLSLTRKPFFPTTSRSFGTFYEHENLNVIHSFKVSKPWCGNYRLRSKEIPKCGHRLSFSISYSENCSVHDDFPIFDGDGPDVKVSSAYIWIEPARNICFRQMKAGSGDDCVKDGNKVKIRYELYDNQSRKLRYSTYSKQDPEILGPGKNEICQGLYEGIVGMQLGEIRRIVLPPSSDLTREHSKSGYWNIQKLLPNQKPSADSEEYRTYDVKLLKIIP